MSSLTLVRHGQVASFEGDSDRLSAAGLAQAGALAAWWIRHGVEFDEVFTGTLPRHTATERAVAMAMSRAEKQWPAAIATAGWNEYDAAGVLGRLAPELAERDADFAKLLRAYRHAAESDRARSFQRMFEAAMLRWLEGESPDGVEPWAEFRDRVRAALGTILGGETSGRRVAVFTSGGPIGVAVQTSMAAPDRSFLEVNWRVRNASVTEFVFGAGRFTLDSFNHVAHLEAGLRTWR